MAISHDSFYFFLLLLQKQGHFDAREWEKEQKKYEHEKTTWKNDTILTNRIFQCMKKEKKRKCYIFINDYEICTLMRAQTIQWNVSTMTELRYFYSIHMASERERDRNTREKISIILMSVKQFSAHKMIILHLFFTSECTIRAI